MKRMPAGNLTKVIITYKEVSGIENLVDGNFRVSFICSYFQVLIIISRLFGEKLGYLENLSPMEAPV